MNWDCHVHVFGETDHYPLAAMRNYTPALAGLTMLRAHLQAVDAGRVVLVQPTVYGHNHQCLIDALEALGDMAVAVTACPEPDATPPVHPRIVGLRLDLRGTWSAAHDRRLDHALRVSESCGCHLELQVSDQALRPLGGLLSASPLPVVLDHLAGLSTDSDADAFEALERLVDMTRVFVKLSALERLPGGVEAALPIAGRIARLAPGRLLWASDWPHTPLHPARELRLAPLPFRDVDDAAILSAIATALGSEVVTSSRREAPERVYGRHTPDSSLPLSWIDPPHSQ